MELSYSYFNSYFTYLINEKYYLYFFTQFWKTNFYIDVFWKDESIYLWETPSKLQSKDNYLTIKTIKKKRGYQIKLHTILISTMSFKLVYYKLLLKWLHTNYWYWGQNMINKKWFATMYCEHFSWDLGKDTSFSFQAALANTAS